MVTGIHVLVIFLNNYSGQNVVNTSLEICNETYNSQWYDIPLESQKMLLLILANSFKGVHITFGGLFYPSYEGLATMLSSSFSYFTVLYSI
ncbi:uncharacterized protein LOC144477971 [Augochlora pura]